MSDPNENSAEVAPNNIKSAAETVLDWIKVVGPLLVSWPVVALVCLLIFRAPLIRVVERFTETPGSSAEIGAIKVVFGPTVLPPEFRPTQVPTADKLIDLSALIGPIRDTGPEATTVGFAVAYALQASVKVSQNKDILISVRSIISGAKKYDDFPGEMYEGSSIVGALRALRSEGALTEQEWPYSSQQKPASLSSQEFKISSFSELDIRTIDQIVSALRDGKVVLSTISVTPDFDRTGGDGRVVIKQPLAELGLKAVAIVGYDPKRSEFKFANDWGARWGAGGFGYIRDIDLLAIIRNAYSLET